MFRGEEGGVRDVELHMMAGMLAARGRSCTWIAVCERERERDIPHMKHNNKTSKQTNK